MSTGELPLPINQEFVNTPSIRSQLIQSLSSSKAYRRAFVEESISTRLAAQIKAIRDQKGWDIKQFAAELNKKVSWIYRLEDPNATPPTIPTLLQIAETFDIGLDVRFVSFSELINDVTTLSPSSFQVVEFDDDPDLKEKHNNQGPAVPSGVGLQALARGTFSFGTGEAGADTDNYGHTLQRLAGHVQTEMPQFMTQSRTSLVVIDSGTKYKGEAVEIDDHTTLAKGPQIAIQSTPLLAYRNSSIAANPQGRIANAK